MADKITIKLEGVEDAISALKKYQVIKRGAIESILKEVGLKVEGDAKRTASAKKVFKTGRLIGSISTNWSGSNMPYGNVSGPTKRTDGISQPDGPKGLVVVVGSNVKYAPYQELGTKKMAARPFLYPAYHGHEGEILKRISKVMKKKA